MTASAGAGSLQIRPAARRRAATVSVDLRAPGQAMAVAVDGKGDLSGWAIVSAGDDGAGDASTLALAKLALGKLAARLKTLRILLGSEHAQVGFSTQDSEPGEGEIRDTLLAEGHKRLSAPAVAAAPLAPRTWLVAAGAASTLEPLADGLVEVTAVEPAFVVDQLLVSEGLEAGSAIVEHGEPGLLIAIRGQGGSPLVRAMPPRAGAAAAADGEQAAKETLATLTRFGSPPTLEVVGSKSASLSRALTEEGLQTRQVPLPTCGGETLPAGCALAWRLATDPEPRALRSPHIAKRKLSLAWARRVTWAAVALGLLGVLMVAAGLTASWGGRARSRALASQNSAVEDQMKQLQETAALAEEVQGLRTDLAGQTLPWPRLAVTLATVARDLPTTVGCRRLAVIDGEFELEATTAGPGALRQLELAQRTIDRSPGISNLSWDEPTIDEDRVVTRQVFHGKVRAPSGPSRGTP